jgi:F0F1-type ATP synthase alpha subunit
VVLTERTSEGFYSINPKLSITRVGTRAYPKALTDLAPQVRLDLAQAADARK